VQDYEEDKAALNAERDSVQSRLAALEEQAKDSPGRAEFDEVTQQINADLAKVIGRLQSASTAASPADPAAPTSVCVDEGCIPTVRADGKDVWVSAPGGKVQFSSAACNAGVDLCLVQQQVEQVLAAVYGMGSE
jgi:hypothetical protein